MEMELHRIVGIRAMPKATGRLQGKESIVGLLSLARVGQGAANASLSLPFVFALLCLPSLK